jgi:hypothetical protein
MAKIPTYTSRAAAASTSGIPRASGIPFRDFASPGIIEAGKQIGAIADQLLKSAEDDAVGQATLNATLKFNDLQMELQTMDPMQAISSFDDRANAILEEAGGGLSSNAASRFRNAMRREFASKKIAVQKDGITRGRQKLEANLVSRMAGLASSAQATDNDTIYQQRADEARQAIDEAIANRVIAADVGERYYQNYLKDADSARASFDMQKDPDNFVENIKSGEYLPSLTGEQRATLQKQGNEILERRQRTATTKRNAAEREYISTVDTVLSAVKSGAPLTPDMEEITSPEMIAANISDKTKAAKYSVLVQDAKEFYGDTQQLSKMSVPALVRMQAAYEAEAAQDQGTAFDLQNQNAEQAVQMKKLIDGLIDEKQKTEAKKIASALLADKARNSDTPLPDEKQRILSSENIKEVFANDQSTAAKFIRLVDDQKQFNEIQKALPSLSRRAVAVVREEMKRQVENVDQTSEEQEQNLKQLKNFETASATLAKARRDDPVGQALLNNDAVRESTQDLETALQTGDPDQARAAYARHKSILEQYHEDIGTEPGNRRFFSNAMAKREVDFFKRMPPADAADRIKLLRNAMGNDWPTAMNELQNKEKLPESVAQLMVVDDDQTREQMIQVERNGGFSAIADKIPNFNKKSFDQEVKRKVETLSRAADIAGLSMSGAITKAVGTVAIGNLLRGDVSVSTAIDEAYDEVVRQQYNVVSFGKLRGIVTKQDYDSQNTQPVEAGLQNWFRENPNFEFHERNHVSFSKGITDERRQGIMLQLAQQQGRWQLTPDGTAAELHINGTKAFDVAGRPVRVSVDEAIAIGKRAIEQNRSRSRRGAMSGR